MNRKDFLKNTLFSIASIGAISSIGGKETELLPKVGACSLTTGGIKEVYFIPSEELTESYKAEYIARYNKQFIQNFDDVVFKILNKKSKVYA